MKRKQTTIVMGLLLGATVILLLAPQTALGQVYSIPDVPVDLGPDGNTNFLVNWEVLDVPYQDMPAGIELSTTQLSSSDLSITWEVTVTNLTNNLFRDAVLTVENYGVIIGDPPGVILYDTVWNPPALAGEIPQPTPWATFCPPDPTPSTSRCFWASKYFTFLASSMREVSASILLRLCQALATQASS